MGQHGIGHMLRVPFVGATVVAVCVVGAACNVVIGLDQFTTNPNDIPPTDSRILCVTKADCPGNDDECSQRACHAGYCEPLLTAEDAGNVEQLAGDCKRNKCDGMGNLDSVIDTTDVSNDENECTIEACQADGMPLKSWAPASTKCAMGVCDGKGTCVECASDTECAPPLVVCSNNHCVDVACTNGNTDGDETDKNCGGTKCQPCADGLACLVGSDCQNISCVANVCAMASCTDGLDNGKETDVDCGGVDCDPCADGKTCSGGTDCTSKICTMNKCQAATCYDGVQNGNEKSLDCGGDTCDACAMGATCTANVDCASEFCLNGICTGIVQVVAGTNHTCAIVETQAGNGKLYCWGGNNYGELGIGVMGTAISQPDQAVNLENVTSVSTFSNTGAMSLTGGHTCARHVMGGAATFSCWGNNGSGQLGDGTQTSRVEPKPVGFPNGVVATQMVAGGRHTCVITNMQHVYCWGANGQGQVGNNGGTSFYKTPQSVVGNPLGATQLALGSVHTCARLTTGEVSCWGQNLRGQLGIGNLDNKKSPQKLTTITGVMQLTAGQEYTCGLANTGLLCWGDNSSGQFGQAGQYFTTPTAVSNILAIQPFPFSLGASGSNVTYGGHSCFVLAGGKLVCLGLNDYGQVGIDKGTPNTSMPTEVTIGPVKQVSLGTQFSCALLEKGAIRCWGRNDLSQLGHGDTVQSHVPVPVKWPGL